MDNQLPAADLITHLNWTESDHLLKLIAQRLDAGDALNRYVLPALITGAKARAF